MRESVRSTKKGLNEQPLCIFFVLLTGLLFFVAQVRAQASFPDQRTIERGRQYESHFVEIARQHGVDARLLWVIAYLESRFRPEVVSYKGARGLMQLMPATAQRFGVGDSHQPTQAIAGAARYARFLLQRYGGRFDLTLAAYNAGETTVDAYRVGRAVRVGNKFINPNRIITGGVPPYRETQKYVRDGLQLLQYLPATNDALNLEKLRTQASNTRPDVVIARPFHVKRKSISYDLNPPTEGMSEQSFSEAVQFTAKNRSISFQNR